ncbi:hypothetical protein FQN54_005714 [Arachnomyces sp. PD_36]|nr:hypothetical protein FQN54_005714 [Arachnomyces sp. PD_36]
MSSQNENPSSPVPKTKRTPPEQDDWRQVKDRKEKKKIQNRIAQRTYRSRIKARLEHFEAMLAAEEGSEESSTTRPRGPSAASHDSSLSTTILERPQVPSGDIDQSAPQLMDMSQPSLRGQPRNEDIASIYANGGHFVQKPHYPDPFMTHAYTAPPHSYSPTSREKLQELLNMLGSKNQLFDMLESIHCEPESRDGGNQTLGNIQLLPNTSQVDLTNNMLPFTPSDSDTCSKFGTQKEVEAWGQDSMILNPTQTPLSRGSPATQPMNPNDYAPNVETLNLNSIFPEPTAAPGSSLSLDERLETVIEGAAKLGFENFDTLVKDYYTHTFENASSSIANEQRMSRNRRLPTVLEEIFSAANDWSEWERRGFFEEVVRMTESLLISEATASQSVLEEKLEPLINSCADDQTPSKSDLASMSRLIQNNLPNFWMLVIAPTFKNRALKQNGHSNVAVAAIMLLRSAGRLRKEQLLDLVAACL